MIAIVIGVVLLVVLVLFLFSTYTVVGNNQAHVIVFMGGGRRIITPVFEVGGKKIKTSYFYIPFLMKRSIMPLTNVKLDIINIPLNDKEMAPFVCDVVTWLHIEDPVKAAERLDFSQGNVFNSLHQDLTAIVQAIARAAAMKQEILEIMRDRATFSSGVSVEVDSVLKSWGVTLVNLEVNDIRDGQGSTVIQNYEEMRKAGVASLARIEIAKKNREAVEAEQENIKLAEIATANSQKEFTLKQIEKDTSVGIAVQEKDQSIAVAASKTNEQKVGANRVITVGNADVAREAAITEAEGKGEAIRIQGEKEAAIVSLKGKAQGESIEATGTAEAKVKDLMAKALKEFNDAGIDITKINANVEVQKAYAEAYAAIAANAEIKIVTGGQGGNILGLPMNAETGAGMGQMVEAFGGVEKVKDLIDGFTKKGVTKE